MAIQLQYDAKHGLATMLSESVVLHCNHYNRTLQQTIEDAEFADPAHMLSECAWETVLLKLQREYGSGHGIEAASTLSVASEIFSHCGFGTIDFSAVSAQGGEVVQPSSHYGMAVKLNYGERKEPGEHFDRGFIRAALGCAFGVDFDVTQIKSISLGDSECRYKVKPNGNSLTLVQPQALPEFVDIAPRTQTTRVDEDAIVAALCNLPLQGDAEGLIPAFGVYLTRMCADYYNKISFRFEQALAAKHGSAELASQLLVEAGHVCGFNTMGGIMLSDEWRALIMPMIDSREDWLHGITACINALGWGVWRVQELEPDKRLVMRVYEGYESLGHLRWFGKAQHRIDYLATGVSAALMNLLYHGDIISEPTLDQAYYARLFSDAGCFVGKQTLCLASGDDYSEIVVERPG